MNHSWPKIKPNTWGGPLTCWSERFAHTSTRCHITESHSRSAGAKFVRWGGAGDLILDGCLWMRWLVMSTRCWAGGARCSGGRPLVVWQRGMTAGAWLVPGISWAQAAGR
jgi:hypothetical protein